MALPLTLLSLLLSLILVSGKLVSDDWTTERPRKGELEEGRQSLMRNRDRQQRSAGSQGNDECQEGNQLCAPTMLKVLDFSADNDHAPDSNGEYTKATLEAGPLPVSFTICLAFMVEAWTAEFTAAKMFTLLDDDDGIWGYIKLYAASSHTKYEVRFGRLHAAARTEVFFYPLQWSRACLYLDSNEGRYGVVW